MAVVRVVDWEGKLISKINDTITQTVQRKSSKSNPKTRDSGSEKSL